MAAISVTYTFINGQTSDGPQVSQNFTDIVNGLSDGTKDLTVAAISGSTLTLSGNVLSNLSVTRSSSGGTVGLTVSNTSNTASSAALATISVAGTSAADAQLYFTVSGTTDWSIGIDNSASDALVISRSSALGTNNALSISTSNVSTFGAAVLLAAGTAGAPGIAFSDDADGSGTGIYRSAANAFSISTNGTGRFTAGALGNLSNSGSVSTDTALLISPSAPTMTAATQYGVLCQNAFAADATTAAYNFIASSSSAASAYTLTLLANFYSVNTTKGAGSTITRHVGLLVEQPTQGGTANLAITDSPTSFSSSLFIAQNGTAASQFGGIVNHSAGLRTKVSTANVSNPPTDAELDSALGAPATLGAGFMAIVDDNDAHTNEYLVWTDGTTWFHVAGTLST